MTRELLSSYINLQWSQWNFRDFLVLLDKSMTHKIRLLEHLVEIFGNTMSSMLMGNGVSTQEASTTGWKLEGLNREG